MTQEKLAEALHCSVDLISAIERGSRTLTNENAAAMSEIFGVRKEFLLCFDNCKTALEKRALPIAERIVALKNEKDAFHLYLDVYGYSIILVTDTGYESMSIDDFSSKNEQEQDAIVADIINGIDSAYYSFRNKDGIEVGRCDVDKYNAIVKEISEFAEFKIKKVCEGR